MTNAVSGTPEPKPMPSRFSSIFGVVLAVALIAGRAGAETRDSANAEKLPESQRQTAQADRELWAELYFAGFAAFALGEGEASKLPMTLPALHGSPYLVWVPKAPDAPKEVSEQLEARGVLARRRLTDLQAELLRKKHRGESPLKAGELVFARSDDEVLFAAGLRGEKDGRIELFGPRVIHIRKNQEGARAFVYRQVLRAVKAFKKTLAKTPESLEELTQHTGTLNPEAGRRWDLNEMFREAMREVNAR